MEKMAGQIDVALIAGQHIFGDAGGRLVGALICLGLVSSISAMTWIGPRVTQVMGEDIPMMRAFASKSQTGVPATAILFQLCVTTLLMATRSFESVLDYIQFSLTFCSFLAVLGVIVLRVREPDLKRPYRMWGYPFTPAVFLAVTTFMMYYLVIERPWPGMFRTLFGDDERYVQTYFSNYGPEIYFTGDGAKQDDDGYYWLMGRIDDVINVAGHRLSTTEIESTLVEHPSVAEAAATGAFDPERGQRIVCFVLLREGFGASDELSDELREFVAEKIGKIARPAAVLFGEDLPKTRSGKIMRRLLKNIAEGQELGDTTTLRDPAIVEDLKHKADRALGRAGS
jgi:acyl-CoA synthetase (AMP-forming)/AMP-acid ligase II